MRKKVLIAEDEASILASLEFLMRDAGYDVRSVMRGDEVLTATRNFVPDLIVLDVMLPQRSGFEICREIRENSDWSQIRIVMLSARGRNREVQRGLGAGADAYITKPFATSELCECVRTLLGHNC